MPISAWFKDLTIRQKLIFVFGILCLATLTFGAITWHEMRSLAQTNSHMEKVWLPNLQRLTTMKAHLSSYESAAKEYRLCTEESCRQTLRGTLSAEKEGYQADRQTYLSQTKESLSALDAATDSYLRSTSISPAANAPDNQSSNDALLSSKEEALYSQALQMLNSARDESQKKLEEERSHAEQAYLNGRILLLIGLLVVVVLTFCAQHILGKLIAHPLVRVAQVLRQLENKDLTQSLPFHAQDEVGQVAISLNRTVSSLNAVLRDTRASSHSLEDEIGELAEAAKQQADISLNQSSQVQQVAAAAQELEAVIREIADNTSQAARSSQTSAEQARAGGVVIEKAVSEITAFQNSTSRLSEKMQQLGKSSQEIGKILSVITEIAEQTNLLALNATIESARAGEHGRGFAVVAAEVRRLAEKTQTSAEEISKMIASIQDGSKEALSLAKEEHQEVQHVLAEAKQSGAALKAIIGSANASEQLIAQIAAATTQQTAAAGEISGSMAHIARMIEESASIAQTASSRSEKLVHMAHGMNEHVRQFRLESKGHTTKLLSATPEEAA